jgi:hypothetical protein
VQGVERHSAVDRWHLMDSAYGLHRIGVAQYTGYSFVYRSFEEPYAALRFAHGPMPQGQPALTFAE